MKDENPVRVDERDVKEGTLAAWIDFRSVARRARDSLSILPAVVVEAKRNDKGVLTTVRSALTGPHYRPLEVQRTFSRGWEGERRAFMCGRFLLVLGTDRPTDDEIAAVLADNDADDADWRKGLER